MKRLTKKQIKKLRKIGYDKTAIANMASIPNLETLTVVDAHGFIHDLETDGSLTPRRHNLEEDLRKKEIVKAVLVSGDGSY